MKNLKIWNGRGHGTYSHGHIYVAAYSVKQASELVGKACGFSGGIGQGEINKYYAKGCWGNSMDDIIPTEPCVYASDKMFSKPFRVL